MAATFLSVQGNFKQRYGRWIEPLPDEHTLADYGSFIPGESRPGLGYNFPVLTGIEHGQTADNTNNAFTINAAIDSQVLNATLDGATILLQAVVSYDSVYKSLNGTGNGSQGGAFKTALDQSVQALLMGGALYRELALCYGPGTSAAVASNIGILSALVSGTNVTACVISITQASWIPGLWILAGNMLVDIYQANGSTVRSKNVKVLGRVSGSLSQLSLDGSASTVPAAVPAATDVIVPKGWQGVSCFGLEAIYNNTGVLFGINAGVVAPWRAVVFTTVSAAGLTRARIMRYAAQVSMNGCKNGGKLFVSAPTFADLAEEASALQRYTANTDAVKRQGASQLTYETVAGLIEVVVYQYAKQGQAMFIANDNFRRVGSTDLTMRPISGLPEAFLTQLTDRSGLQMKVFSNQAPVFEMPYRNFMITNIVNNGDITPT